MTKLQIKTGNAGYVTVFAGTEDACWAFYNAHYAGYAARIGGRAA